VLPAIGALSHRGAELYRRLHGALLGRQGQAAGHARRHQEGGGGVQGLTHQDGLLQRRHPRRLLRAAGMDPATCAVSLPSPDEREAALYARLAALGIAWKTHAHAPVFTVEEATALYASQPGGHTKNLFLKDKKDGLWLVTLRDDLKVDLN